MKKAALTQYAIRRKWLKTLVFLQDCLLRQSKKTPSIPPPKRILLSCLGHLGDVTIASSVLPHIKQKYPQAEIGFLIGSWAQPFFEHHPLVTTLHCFDHICLTRHLFGLQRLRHYSKQRATTIEEIKQKHYDHFVELYPFFPNAISLTVEAHIPVRIGFSSGGFGPKLTCPVPFSQKEGYLLTAYPKILEALSITPHHLTPSPPPAADVVLPPSSYVVFHIGSGQNIKLIREENWETLKEYVLSKRIHIVFTGTGEEENTAIVRIISDSLECTNYCDHLQIGQLVSLLKHSVGLVSTDSFPVHLAGGMSLPILILRQHIIPCAGLHQEEKLKCFI